MKTRLFTLIQLFFVVASLVAFGGSDSDARKNQVVIYTYDSFISEWGPAPQLEQLFEKETGMDLVFIDSGDGGQILSRVVLEKEAPQADIVIGIDNNQIKKARQANVFEPYKPVNAESVIGENLLLTEDYLLTPYDWSYFAMIYDTHSTVPAPSSLSELTKDIYRKKIILMDPRTSTPGMGFVAWTVAAFGEKYLDFWQELKPNILTMAPSWSTGYGLFTSGEAPLVISYTTSPAYHVEYNEGNRFQAIMFDQGHPLQIEGVALVKNAANPEGAKKFIDFLVSQEGQDILPLTQWMYPVNPKVELPASYEAAPLAKKALVVDNEVLSDAVKAIMELLSE